LRRTTPIRILGLILVLALFAAACGGDDDDTATTADDTATTADDTATTTTAAGATDAPTTTATAGGPVQGGTLVYGAFGDMEGWDPEQTSSLPATTVIHNVVYEYLLEMAPDGSGIQGALGDFEWSDDGLTMTFTLRDDVKFHDGSDLTSADVLFSLERAQAGPNWGYPFGGLTFEAPDDYTFVINLEGPNSDLPSFLSTWYAPIFPADFGGMTEADFFQAPISAGPFKAATWEPGERVVLERFDDYYGTKAYLDEVIWQVFTDPNAAVIAFENGEVDALLQPPIDLIDTLPGQLVDGRVTSFVYMTLAQHGQNLGDVHARKALLYAIDKDVIREAVYGPYADPAVSLHGPIDLYPDFYAAADNPYTYDPAKAAEELALAGMPNGYETTMIYEVGSPELQTMAEIIQAQAGAVGIDITLVPLEGGAIGEMRVAAEQDLWISIVEGVILPLSGEIPQFTAILNGSRGSYDTTDLQTECVDPLLSSTDPQVRQEAMRCYENWITDNAALDALMHPHQVIAHQDNVNGISLKKGVAFDAFEEVWKS
jgi:ABC-type transport system substrate-binding protein